jgi:hypothetical protein
MGTNILKDSVYFIFRSVEALSSSSMLVSIYQTTQRHMLGDKSAYQLLLAPLVHNYFGFVKKTVVYLQYMTDIWDTLLFYTKTV